MTKTPRPTGELAIDRRTGGSAAAAPSRHRQAIVVWVAIYPTITLVQALFGEALATLPLPLRTAVLTGGLVPLLVYVLIPALQRLVDRALAMFTRDATDTERTTHA